jgi:hypothetical protein
MSSSVSPRGDGAAATPAELMRRSSKTRVKVRVRKTSSGRASIDAGSAQLVDSDDNTNEVDAALSKSSSSAAGFASLLVTDVEDAPLRRLRVEHSHLHVRASFRFRCFLFFFLICCFFFLFSDRLMLKGSSCSRRPSKTSLTQYFLCATFFFFFFSFFFFFVVTCAACLNLIRSKAITLRTTTAMLRVVSSTPRSTKRSRPFLSAPRCKARCRLSPRPNRRSSK